MLSLQELLGLGASLDPPDRNGSTPLFLACEQGHAETAALLLQAGACPRAQNRAEERPLYIASLRGHANVVSKLLKALQSQGLPWQVRLHQAQSHQIRSWNQDGVWTHCAALHEVLV